MLVSSKNGWINLGGQCYPCPVIYGNLGKKPHLYWQAHLLTMNRYTHLPSTNASGVTGINLPRIYSVINSLDQDPRNG